MVKISMNNDLHKAHVDAYNDAKKDINILLWFLVGIVGNLFGVIIAAVIEPSTPTSRLYLFECTPEYIAYYSDNYKIKAKSIQRNWAAIGFVSQFVMLFLLLVWLE